MTTQTYHEASMVLLQQAEVELAAGDIRQASEKGWGAAAQIAKAAAEQRSWPHRTHADLFRAVDGLTTESGDGNLSNLFQVANSLHQNCYENWDTKHNVERALLATRSLVEIVSSLL